MIVLFVPWVLLLIVIFAIVLLLFRWYKTSVFLFVAALVVNGHWHVFAFGLDSLSDVKSGNELRVMTWNVCCSDSTFIGTEEGLAERIIEQNADLVYLTEYNPGIFCKADSILSAFYTYKEESANECSMGLVYSKLPVSYEGNLDNHSVSYYKVDFGGKIVDLCCCHLLSNNTHEDNTWFYPDSIKNRSDLRSYLDNYGRRSVERMAVVDSLVVAKGVRPCIVMGDMNDVEGSQALRRFEIYGYKDAWWCGGIGYGATKHDPVPYRIDHIFFNNVLRLSGITIVSGEGLSDHDGLVADFGFE